MAYGDIWATLVTDAAVATAAEMVGAVRIIHSATLGQRKFAYGPNNGTTTFIAGDVAVRDLTTNKFAVAQNATVAAQAKAYVAQVSCSSTQYAWWQQAGLSTKTNISVAANTLPVAGEAIKLSATSKVFESASGTATGIQGEAWASPTTATLAAVFLYDF